jgi:hypothetical protein
MDSRGWARGAVVLGAVASLLALAPREAFAQG